MAEEEKSQQKALEVIQQTTERVTRVEMTVQNIVVEQSRLANVLEKQTELLARVIESQQSTDLAAVAIRERTDVHSKNIEALQKEQVDMKKEQVDTGKMLEGFKTQFSIIRIVGGALLTISIGYLFSHFLGR